MKDIKFIAKYFLLGIVAIITAPIWSIAMLGAWFVRDRSKKSIS